jgi:hypothetical protein
LWRHGRFLTRNERRCPESGKHMLRLKNDTKKTVAGAAFRSYAKKIPEAGFLWELFDPKSV